MDSKKILVIGIAGGAGSGKTTAVKKIIENLNTNDIALVSQDSYYKDAGHLPLNKRKKINFDHPDSIEFELLTKHVKQLKGGNNIDEPIYSYVNCTRSKETKTIETKKIIIVEGILIFSCEELRNLFDIKVFVSADADDRLARVINRDTVERGRKLDDILSRYYATVKPMHLQFIEPSKRYADIIIPEGAHNNVAINILTSVIKQNIQSHGTKN